MTWPVLLALANLVANAVTGHDFGACARYLATIPEGTKLQRTMHEVPAHLRVGFDGTAKLMIVGTQADRLYFVTTGDMNRAGGIKALDLRATPLDAEVLAHIQDRTIGRPYDLVAQRRSPRFTPGARLTPDQLGSLGVGDVVERFGVYYVLHRAVRARTWQYEAWRFNRPPRIGDRANGAASVVAGEFTWAGEVLIGRHANVISVDPGCGDITFLVLQNSTLPPPRIGSSHAQFLFGR